MKIIGINISHDVTVAQVTDSNVDFLYEEERHRREKYWCPRVKCDDSTGDLKGEELLSIVHKQVETPDKLVFTSFDRRNLNVDFNPEESMSRIQQIRFTEEVAEKQLTRERLQYLAEKYSQFIRLEEISMKDDLIIADTISNQLKVPATEYHYEIEHHLYHAECGYHLSPYRQNGEDAIAIVWDGGGCKPYFDELPNYQEIETIYRCSPDGITKQWQKLSNKRFCDEISSNFPNMLDEITLCREDLEVEINGVPHVITSMPSCGMNFSQLSYALGCDDEGRCAGKVMGMASYSTQNPLPNLYSHYQIAQQCELESFEYSCDIIQNAIDMNPDCKNIVLSGGYSLNCTNNYKYLERFPDHQIFVDPVPHDGGTAIGAAINVERKLRNGGGE